MKNFTFILGLFLITSYLTGQTTSFEIDANSTAHFYQNVKIGEQYTTNYPALDMYDNKFICFNARNTEDAGILFHEIWQKGTNYVRYGAKIAYNEGADELQVSTYNGSTSFVQNNVMRISRSGYIGIKGTPSSAYALKIYGSAYTSGTWTSSDSTAKTDIKKLEKERSKLKEIKGVSYYRKADLVGEKVDLGTQTIKVSVDSVSTKEKKIKREYGFLAQEVQEVYPDMVREDEDGTLAINYNAFIPLLVEAYKEQETEMDSLKVELALLQKQMDAVLKELDLKDKAK